MNCIYFSTFLPLLLPCFHTFSIVEAYNKLFGKLPLVKKKGKFLVDALKSQPGIEVTGDKLSNQVVALSDEQRPCLQASAEKIDSSLGTEVQ